MTYTRIDENTITYMDGETKVTIKNDYSVGKSQEDVQKILDEIAEIYNENFNINCKITYSKEKNVTKSRKEVNNETTEEINVITKESTG